MKRLAILGSTGSIGRSTLNIVESYPDRFSVVSLAAGNNLDLAFEQTIRHKPRLVSMASTESADKLAAKLKTAGHSDIEVTSGNAYDGADNEVGFWVGCDADVAGISGGNFDI